jgi:hypothetical protein
MLRQMQVQMEYLWIWWCRQMHTSVRWPIHGRYNCATCGRTYTVPWHASAEPGARERRRALTPETAVGYLP